MTGADLITKERIRQSTEEGWTPEHDDQHRDGQLSMAAIAYIAEAIGLNVRNCVIGTILWPWSPEWDKRKKHGPVRCLVIAGALVAAEIDRRLRAGAEVDESTTPP